MLELMKIRHMVKNIKSPSFVITGDKDTVVYQKLIE